MNKILHLMQGLTIVSCMIGASMIGAPEALAAGSISTTDATTGATPCVLVSSYPADGAEVEKLDVFQTVWEGDETADDIEAQSILDGIYLSNEAGDIVTYGKMRSVPSGLQISLDEVVTAPGAYTLTITAGMVHAANFDYDTFDMVPVPGTENAETVLHFSIASAVQPCVLVSSTPEDGATVDKLDVFQTVWEGDETADDIEAQSILDGIYLSNEAGDIVTYGKMRSVPSGLQISLDEVVTAPGAYTLTITAGMVRAANFDYDTFDMVPVPGTENAETVLHFTIASAVQPCVLVSSTPEDGATVDKLGVLQTVWEGEETEWGMDALSIRDGIYLSNEAGDIVTYGRMRSVPTGFQISLDEEVTAPGNYTLTITAGMIFAGADFDEETFKLVPLAGSENAETVLHFTIAPAVQPCVLVSSTPEDGATVDKLDVIQTVWEGEETDFGMDVLSIRDGIYLSNEAGDIVTYGKMRSVPTGIQISLDDVVTTPGEYTLTITAGMVFAAADFDEETFELLPLAGSENAETVLSFKVSENVGVGTIAVDSEAIRYIGGELTVAGMEQPAISVYTLTGELVAAGTSGAYDLLPGVYVVKAAEQGKEAVAKIIVK